MVQRINQEGIDLIKQWEGLRLTAYKPLEHDVWTIGYGHTTSAGYPIVTQGMTITEADAEAILRTDLRLFEACVNNCVTVPLTDNQFAALVSLCFNIGCTAFRNSTLVKKLNAGDYSGAQEQFHVWRKSGGKVVQGLVNRRAQEAALFGRGEFVSSNHVDAEEAKEPVLTAERVTWGATALTSLGAISSGNGSIQHAVAFCIVVGFIAALVFFWRKRERT